ncbi:hypothetical protein ACO2Q9_06310 [Variovorax sp. VNK109]|uniref:hypothetical protein n=1 Tax=Variovorax sp. VNK109 TaxID=3400919 RepID=UPI003BFCD865
MTATLLTPEFIAIIDRGVSSIVASRSLDMKPSIMRAVGARITPDGTHVTVFVSRPASRQLLQDIATTGTVSVVFSVPFTHQTVQVKASRGVEIRPAGEQDRPVLARYLKSMEFEIGRVGYGPAFTRKMLSHDLAQTVAIGFTPEQAFDQTPGPRAGRRMEPSA